VHSGPVLQLTGITKRFSNLVANDHVDLTVERREIHAIVGENGAGKSTLMSVLYGLLEPDEGEIRVHGQLCHFGSPLDAMAVGLGMVFQRFQLLSSLTVAENVIYGNEPRTWGIFIDRAEANRRVAELGHRYGLFVEPTERIENLPVGQRQRVEILKALYRDAEIMILDEPTAVLTPQETDDLLSVLTSLKEDGRTILLITHKLREVMDIADRATVLRRGRVVASRSISETDPQQLSADMTGRTVDLGRRRPDVDVGPDVLVVSNVSVAKDGQRDPVSNVSLSVGSSEIVGIAAIAGNGQEELVKAIAGLAPTATGEIAIGGTRIEALSVEERRKKLLAYVPEDRHAVGTAGSGSVAQNLLMGYQRADRHQRRGWLKRPAIQAHADNLVEEFDVAAADVDVATSALSGGNLQKVVIARELGHNAAVLIAEQPTRGVDVGSIEFIHQEIIEYRDRGGAVLLISAELGELLALSTRILVMSDGRITAELDPKITSEADIGLYMTGAETASPSDRPDRD
jgi:general nucleoside transport system ATP-binding protein